MGMSPQSGLPHNNRVGDFDPFALPVLHAADRQDARGSADDLADRSGLLGLSGVSGDVRDMEAAAAAGNARARLALDVFVAGMRHYLGAHAGRTGRGRRDRVHRRHRRERRRTFAPASAQGLEELGIVLDPAANAAARGEGRDQRRGSRMQIWIVPTNEELIVARQTKQLLDRSDEGANAMFIAKVTGSVVATQKVDSMVGHKLLVVEPYRLDPKTAGGWSPPAERSWRSTRSGRAKANSC